MYVVESDKQIYLELGLKIKSIFTFEGWSPKYYVQIVVFLFKYRAAVWKKRKEIVNKQLKNVDIYTKIEKKKKKKICPIPSQTHLCVEKEKLPK